VERNRTRASSTPAQRWVLALTSLASLMVTLDTMAVELLELCPLLVDDSGRHGRFAAPVTVSALACPSDRLVAFLGPDPSS
jgi:hypothetical protein